MKFQFWDSLDATYFSTFFSTYFWQTAAIFRQGAQNFNIALIFPQSEEFFNLDICICILHMLDIKKIYQQSDSPKFTRGTYSLPSSGHGATAYE